MFRWLKSILSSKFNCDLCYQEFRSRNPDQIVFEHSDGSTQNMEICPACAGTLELIKKKNENVPYTVSLDDPPGGVPPRDKG